MSTELSENRLCPPDQIIADLIDDRLDQEVVAELEKHLQECPNCQDRIMQLATDEDLWLSVAQVLQKGSKTGHPDSTVQSPKSSDTDTRAFIKKLDGYEFLEDIGRGATGSIVRARDLRLKRDVAIKVFHSIQPEHTARFRNEASATAQLKHPHIIEVFATGMVEFRVFIVMELISSGDLAHYLNGSPIPGRLAARLLRDLADAVQTAHDAGILHRDLKPANVLLGDHRNQQESQGAASETDQTRSFVPKITDFGLAYWLHEGSHLTRTGEFLGTPSYMPPEQARAQEGWATEKVDLYSLGAILYECLTGRPPFRTESVTGTIDLLLRAEPIAPRRLNPEVDRDLETICLKCLEKAPSLRYDSASALVSDLERYLNGRPILARPVPVWEHGYRWVKRHRLVSSLLTIIGATLIALLSLWAWSTQQLRLKTEIAETSAREAEENLEVAEKSNEVTREVLEFIVTDFFDTANNDLNASNLTVVELLQELAPGIEGRFEDRPQVEAALQLVVGNMWRALGQSDRALPHLERGLEIYGDHTEYLDSDADFNANHAYLNCLLDLNRRDEARAVVAYLEGLKDEVDPQRWYSFQLTRASAIRDPNNTQESIEHLRTLYEDSKRTLGADHITTLAIYDTIGVLWAQSGESEKAREIFEEEYRLLRATLGPDRRPTLKTANNLAVALVRTGKYEEAAQIHEDTWERKKRILGEMHRATIETHQNLGMVYWRLGQQERCIEHLEQVGIDFARVLGPTHWKTITIFFQLSEMYPRADRSEEGYRYFSAQVQPIIGQEVLTSDFQMLLVNYARLCIEMDDRENAALLLKIAEQLISKKSFPGPKRRLEQVRLLLQEEVTE